MDYGVVQNFFNQCGWAGIAIAAVVIAIIGVLKFFKLFDKLPKSARKPVYLALNVVLSFALVATYYGIAHKQFNGGYVIFSTALVPVVLAMYSIYENVGLRGFVKWAGSFIVSIVANEQVKAAIEKLSSTVEEQVEEEVTKQVEEEVRK